MTPSRHLCRIVALVVLVMLALPGAQTTVVAQREGTTVPAETRSGENVPDAGTGLDGVGSTFAEFVAVYGEGDEIDPVDSLYEFSNPDFDGFAVFASFSDGVTSHIEFDYGDGLPVESIAGQVEAVLPTDATSIASYAVPALAADEPALRVERYESERLGEVADGRASIIVVYREQPAGRGAGASDGTVVTRATVTIPTASSGTPGRATGDPGGIGLTEDAWEAVYGDGRDTDDGVVYENVTFPTSGFEITAGFDGPDATITSLRFEYDDGQVGGANRDDVLAQQLDSLPEDATFGESYYLPPTPDRPGAIIDRWDSESLAGISGKSGSVIVITQQESARRDASAPPDLVVPRMDIVVVE